MRTFDPSSTRSPHVACLYAGLARMLRMSAGTVAGAVRGAAIVDVGLETSAINVAAILLYAKSLFTLIYATC